MTFFIYTPSFHIFANGGFFNREFREFREIKEFSELFLKFPKLLNFLIY